MDSDGDGRTNGEELGDPDCLWSRSGSASVNVLEAPSGHPGNAILCTNGEELGDPDCLWSRSGANVLEAPTGHPGNATK